MIIRKREVQTKKQKLAWAELLGLGLFRTAGLDLCSSMYEKLNTLNTNLAAWGEVSIHCFVLLGIMHPESFFHKKIRPKALLIHYISLSKAFVLNNLTAFNVLRALFETHLSFFNIWTDFANCGRCNMHSCCHFCSEREPYSSKRNC